MAYRSLKPQRDPAHLSASHHDDDASSSHTSDRSDQDTDSEDDQVLLAARNSSDIRNYDREVLEQEEERDRLLQQARGNQGQRGNTVLPNPFKNLLFNASNSKIDISQTGGERDDVKERQRKALRRLRREVKKEKLMDKAKNGEDGALMYEMEEGGMKEGSMTGESSDSDEKDRKRLLDVQDEKTKKRRQWRRFVFIHLLIAVGFAVLLLLAWRISLGRKTTRQAILNNGTALFGPTTILISLDGFRADFLKRGLTPRMNAFIQEGVSPDYMLPSFPSVTFPNHYTMVTGLYPESHGIVSNTFWDPNMKAEFYNTDLSRSMQPKWWGGEPLWVTAESQGIKTGVHMWPGSEAHIGIEPSYLDKYNGSELLLHKVEKILGFLDKPGAESEGVAPNDMRPQFIAAYVPNVDSDGHLYGPNSTEIRNTINHVDRMLDDLFHGLESRNLTNIVNVVIVSDHGMATTSVDRLIQLEDLIDVRLIEHIDGWPLYGLRPKDPADLQGLYDKLSLESMKNPNFDVYLRDTNMPARYHFSKNDRIAPLWIVPKTGWAIVSKSEMSIQDAKAKGIAYHPRGLHGYDHEHPLMRAIFIARGPAFPHQPNSRVEAFRKRSRIHVSTNN
jgi:predicted AlkP superfamily pyrophosphatase or phosphodiesterase